MDTAAARDGRGAPGIGERILVSLLSLGTVAALFLLRAADDNRLTSWRWVFAGADPLALYALVLLAVAAAHLVARLPLPGRWPGTVLFLASYGAAACSWGTPEVIVDASRYFTQAKYLELHGVGRFLGAWGEEVQAWTDLPLVPLLDGLVLRLAGESRTAVQAFTSLLFAGTAVLTQRVGRTLWDEEVGFLAGALLLGIPYLLTQVPAFLVDVPTMFLFILAVFAVIEASTRGGAARTLLASVAVLLACLAKYSVWLLLTCLPIAVLAARRGGAARALRAGAAIGALSAALVLAVLLLGRDVFAEQLALLRSYQAPGLRRWGESFASTFLFQIHPFLSAAALLSAALAARRRDLRWLVVAWPVLLLLGLEVRRIRYLLPAFPMLALMGAYGLQAVPGRELRRLVVACTVASALVVACYGHLRFLRGTSAMNLKEAGEYLDGIGEERVEVFTRTDSGSEVNQEISVPLLDLFTRKTLVHHPERSPPPEGVARSALRFTWEYRTPGYYAAEGPVEGAAIVVISGDADAPLPRDLAERVRGLRLARSFRIDEGVFRHSTFVDVYRPPDASDQRGADPSR